MAHDHSANGYAGTNGHNPRFTFADRPVPHNLEAERGALGSIMLDASLLPEIRSIIDVADLWRDSHQVLYRAMLDLDGRGAPVDPLTVAEELSRTGRLASVGGDDCLGEILSSVPHTTNARYYAQIVKQKAVARQIIEAANTILDDTYSGNHTAEELVNRVRDLATISAPAETGKAAPSSSLSDVKRSVSETAWLWPSWIIDAHLTVLASEPGIGKTRLALDLARRLHGALPWPDGTMATRPPGSRTLWVPADRNHAELLRAAEAFDIPLDAVRLNAPPDDPFLGLKLDTAQAVAELAGRIRDARAILVIIDTINKATRRLLYRPEEAEAFFGPLLDVARQTGVPILALTHLSRGGDPLDRRIEGVCRVLWKLERPDPEGQPLRRKLHVTKSNALYPSPLGVTMGDPGNDYDLNPPRPPEPGRPAATGPSKAVREAIAWLREYLATGPAFCRAAIDSGIEAGHRRDTLFKAKDLLSIITEGTEDGKIWRLPEDVSFGKDGDDFDGDA